MQNSNNLFLQIILKFQYQWKRNMLIHFWFYIFILYEKDWMYLYLISSQPWKYVKILIFQTILLGRSKEDYILRLEQMQIRTDVEEFETD